MFLMDIFVVEPSNIQAAHAPLYIEQYVDYPHPGRKKNNYIMPWASI